MRSSTLALRTRGYQLSIRCTHRVSGYPITCVLDIDEEEVFVHVGETPSSVYEG